MKCKSLLNLKNLGYVAIIAWIIFYSSNYFANSFPYSEGWFVNYVELINQGKFPYRDFYYYLPPLNLLFDYCVWKLSFGYLLIFRLWYLIERIAIYLLVYRLLCKYIDRKYVLPAVMFSSVLCTADSFDYFGDYNQTAVFIAVCFAYIACNYINASTIKQRNKYLAEAGVLMGIMFLTKQTLAVAFTVVFLLVFLSRAFLSKDGYFFSKIYISIIGAAVPISVCVVFLHYNKALSSFIDNVFLSSDGKGSLIDILFTNFHTTLISYNCWVFSLFFLFMIKKKIFTEKQRMIVLTAIFFLLFAEYQLVGTLTKYIKILFSKPEVIVSAFILLFIVIALKRIINITPYYYFLVAYFLFSGLICLEVMLNPTIYKELESLGLILSIRLIFNQIIFYTGIELLLYYIFICKNNSFRNNAFIMYLASSLAICYAGTMASGGRNQYMPSEYLRLYTPFIIALTIERIDSLYTKKAHYIIIYTLMTFSMSLCFANRCVTAYDWYQVNYPKDEKNFYSDIEALKGIKFSAEDKKTIEKIAELVEKNSTENDYVFGFPYLKMFNVICNRYESYYVPVIWYDVVGDDYVELTLDELKENPPQIFICIDIPNAVNAHEDAFRDGKKLKQREIIDWFFGEVYDDYTMIGQIDDFYVYKRGTNISTTYIERPTKKPSYLQMASDDLIQKSAPKILLKGKGTNSSPYIISNVKELVLFRKYVNEGHSFKGEYVKLDRDISLSDESNWTPIGIDQSGNYFEGIFDGDGHTISDLYILSYDDENVGFFGYLKGTVKNLNIYNAWIGGQYIGGIASQGRDAKIENCSYIGELYGYRGGGIADNIEGDIINCVAILSTSHDNDMIEGISGYYTNNIINSYSNLGDEVNIDAGIKFDSNTVEQLNMYNSLNYTEYDYTWDYSNSKVLLRSKR